jgi:protein-S-isoprenylcysteine O-methyltransferase Ste14
MKSFHIACGKFFFKYRDGLFPIVLIAVLLGFRPMALSFSVPVTIAVAIAGIVIVMAGQLLRVAVIGYVYVKRGGKAKQVYADTLVTTGFFNHCRNPLYVGNLLILAGLAILHGNPYAILCIAVFYLFAYTAIVAAEEEYLQNKFGEEFTAYTKRASRWFINFAGLGKSLEGMRFAWERVILKEYGTITSNAASVVLLIAYKLYRNDAFPTEMTPRASFIGALVAVGLFWAVSRFLKKSKRLREAAE